ncbi:MAG: hypothetical protein II994_09090 [Lachnospiraceae bacterium]|nr:hypothetical protein [Lachnospiraceae bacterium]
MRKYNNGKKLLQVICNQCNKEMKVENGYLKEGCFRADYVFGYFSTKDGMRHRFDLCEECYEKMLEKFSIPVEEVREKELL